MHVYEVRPRKDKRGFDLISDALPFGRLWYGARIVFDCQTVNDPAMMASTIPARFYILHAETGYINFSPVGFKLVARDFRRCADTFKPPKFSIVPYFLYCRAIELGLKAIHLETHGRQDVKDEYGHDLIRSYNALPPERRTLSTLDSDLLAQISRLYERKAFEYVQPGDAGRGYSDFPDLQKLARLATNFASD